MTNKSPVFDLHCDTALRILHDGIHIKDDNPGIHVDIPKMRKGNVDGMVFALWPETPFTGIEAFKRTQTLFDACKKELDDNRNDIQIIYSADDLNRAKSQNKISALIGIEGGVAINNDLENLRHFYNEGVRLMTLTHVKSIDWVGSSGDEEGRKKGLTDFGKDVVKLMNELRMVVDVAHISEKSLLDAAKVSTKPIICSHTATMGVADLKERLCTDEMIQAVAETKGVLGIMFFPILFKGADPNSFNILVKSATDELNKRICEDMTSEEKAKVVSDVFKMIPPPVGNLPGIEGAIDHFDYIIDLVGEDYVAIGTDFDGISFTPPDLTNVGEFDVLRSLMKERGYSDTRIKKIMGDNVKRALRSIL